MISHLKEFLMSEADIFHRLIVIEDHIFINGELELKVVYSSGDQLWYPLDLIKDDDLHTTVNHIISNNLGPINNETNSVGKEHSEDIARELCLN